MSPLNTTTTTCTNQPIVSFKATLSNPSQCPFNNKEISFDVYPGSCIYLTGNSGIGKTSLVTYLCGLSTANELLNRLGIRIEYCHWDHQIPKLERCGVLFQQTTLIDALTVAGNLALALRSSCSPSSTGKTARGFSCKTSALQETKEIKRLIEAVGLDSVRDANKKPTELSGGMARRASFALQLAQQKRVIVLDEPFTGLDRNAAVSVAKELARLRKKTGTALILISHEPDLASIVMQENDTVKSDTTSRMYMGEEKKEESLMKNDDDDHNSENTSNNIVINLESSPYFASTRMNENGSQENGHVRMNLFGITMYHRFQDDFKDYILWSLPLILLAFAACGVAIAMLSADILQKVNVTDPVTDIIEREVKPLIKMLTGEDPGAVMMLMVKIKVRNLLNSLLPSAKANLFSIGLAKLFVLEIGPLLTALLLSGRIGGSYAGKVATMQATAQNKLLTTLGVNAQAWTLVPALVAAMISSPLLTILGTSLAILLGGYIGPLYNLCTWDTYKTQVYDTLFPAFRWRNVQGGSQDKSLIRVFVSLNPRTLFASPFVDDLIETITYPPIFLVVKAIVFIVTILLTAELVARLPSSLSPRHVPTVITSSVVSASLLVIIADWGFSQLWLLRR